MGALKACMDPYVSLEWYYLRRLNPTHTDLCDALNILRILDILDVTLNRHCHLSRRPLHAWDF